MMNTLYDESKEFLLKIEDFKHFNDELFTDEQKKLYELCSIKLHSAVFDMKPTIEDVAQKRQNI